MLCLSRNRGERLLILLPDGRRVEVVVTHIDGGKVRLGISAARDITVLRSELLDAREGPHPRAAAAAPAGDGKIKETGP